jgi:hypothetical protein
MKLLEVSAYDGTFIALADDVVDHIVRKHSEILAFLTLTREDFVKLLCNTLEKPNEVYVDARKSKYFLKKLNDFYLNVIVSEQTVKTAYLINRKTYFKMGRKRWLRRLC